MRRGRHRRCKQDGFTAEKRNGVDGGRSDGTAALERRRAAGQFRDPDVQRGNPPPRDPPSDPRPRLGDFLRDDRRRRRQRGRYPRYRGGLRGDRRRSGGVGYRRGPPPGNGARPRGVLCLRRRRHAARPHVSRRDGELRPRGGPRRRLLALRTPGAAPSGRPPSRFTTGSFPGRIGRSCRGSTPSFAARPTRRGATGTSRTRTRSSAVASPPSGRRVAIPTLSLRLPGGASPTRASSG